MFNELGWKNEPILLYWKEYVMNNKGDPMLNKFKLVYSEDPKICPGYLACQ